MATFASELASLADLARARFREDAILLLEDFSRARDARALLIELRARKIEEDWALDLSLALRLDSNLAIEADSAFFSLRELAALRVRLLAGGSDCACRM
ncbi:hypothetical protein PESHB4_01900 [Pediococcus ethanolidurans]